MLNENKTDAIVTVQNINGVLEQIERCESIEEMITFVKRLDVLKSALKAADTFREKSIQYARLEAAALIRVCDLNGENLLKGKQKQIALWLWEMPEEKREETIAKCSEGVTIGYLYREMVEKETKLRNAVAGARFVEDFYVEKFKEEGIVDFEKASQKIYEELAPVDEKLAADTVDGFRNRIRDMGGHGTSDGIYLTPYTEGEGGDENETIRQNLVKALETKIKNLYAVMLSLRRFARDANVRLSTETVSNIIKGGSKNSGEFNNGLAKLRGLYELLEYLDVTEEAPR